MYLCEDATCIMIEKIRIASLASVSVSFIGLFEINSFYSQHRCWEPKRNLIFNKKDKNTLT